MTLYQSCLSAFYTFAKAKLVAPPIVPTKGGAHNSKQQSGTENYAEEWERGEQRPVQN